MNRVFIIDDEFNIINLIIHLVNWDMLDLRLAGTATDSYVALEQIKALQPDILIADINMPGMNGLELLEKSLEILPDLKAIVVSGYQDFSYAYKAIKYGVEDYLLKPINQKELNQALSRLISSKYLNSSDSAARLYIQALEDKLYSSSTRLRKQYISRLFEDVPEISGLSMETVNSEYEFHFQPGLFAACLLQLDRKEYTISLSNSIFSKAEQLCMEIIGSFAQEWECVEQNAEMMLLFNIAASEKAQFAQKLEYFFAQVKSVVSSYQVLESSLSVGVYVDNFEAITYSCKSAVKVNEARAVLGRNHVLSVESIDDEAAPCPLIPFFNNDVALDTGERRAFHELAMKDMRQMHAFLTKNPYQAFTLYLEYIHRLIDAVSAEFGFPADVLASKKEASELVYEQESLESLDHVTMYFMDKMFDLIQEFKNSDKRIILAAKAYINENSAKHIGLEDVAQHIHLSPTYFGVLFKRETKENFTDYLINIRIEKAKEMLKGIENNISEIAQLVGYSDVKHFSKKFKAIVGVTPNEYRKIYHIYD